MDFQAKVLTQATLNSWRSDLRKQSKRLVVTNGCFDLLHLGHVSYLQEARNLGDALLIGVNGDTAVKKLKGPARPLNNESDRASVLAALEAVSGVFVFEEATATNFLKMASPDIYVKGGDYTLEQLNAEERQAVENCGGRIQILRLIPERSTTGLIAKISSL
ncbi:MAG: rfaE2 [Verrucomicrobiales bacterium]|nr:rfaE2 [Verrucomicrobiales bacterium]